MSEPVIDQLNTHRVTRHDQALVRNIPDGEAKHSIEMIEDISAPLFVAVNDHLGI